MTRSIPFSTNIHEKKLCSVFPALTASFSIFIPFIPIAQYYKSPFPGLNLATFLAAVFLLISLPFFSFKKDRRIIPVSFYFVAVVVNIIATNWIYKYTVNFQNYSYFLRFALLFCSILFVGRQFFDYRIAIKALEVLLISSTFLILIQDISYYLFHFAFNFNIPSLLTTDSYVSVGNRFSGLFLEPSHFSQCACLLICYRLFSGRVKQKDIAIIAVVACGILLSASGQGYLFLGIIYILWCLKMLFSKKTKAKGNALTIVAVTFFLALVFVLIFSSTSVFKNSMSRMVSENGSLGGVALSGRTYTNVLFAQMPLISRVFGIGFGFSEQITSGYINSLYSHLFQFGFFGIVVLLVFLLSSFVLCSKPMKYFIVLYAIMIIFSSVAAPMDLCFFSIFILFGKDLYEKVNN